MKTHFSTVSGPVAGDREQAPRSERAPLKPRRVRIEDLLGGGRELIIEHPTKNIA